MKLYVFLQYQGDNSNSTAVEVETIELVNIVDGVSHFNSLFIPIGIYAKSTNILYINIRVK